MVGDRVITWHRIDAPRTPGPKPGSEKFGIKKMRRPKPPQSYRGLLTKIVNRTKLDRQDIDFVLRTMLDNGAEIVPASKPKQELTDSFIKAYEPKTTSHQKRTARRANLEEAWSAFSDFSPYYDAKGEYASTRRRFIRKMSEETGMAQNQITRIIQAIRDSGAMVAPRKDVGLDMTYAFLETYHAYDDDMTDAKLEKQTERLQAAWQAATERSSLRPKLTEEFTAAKKPRNRRRGGMRKAATRPRAPIARLMF